MQKFSYVKRAKAHGITEQAYKFRIRTGWHKEKASSVPMQKPGIAYDEEMKKIAKRNGIPYPTFAKRVRNLGWTQEEAATIPVMRPGEYLKSYKAPNYWSLHDKIVFTPGLAHYIKTGEKRSQLAK